MLATNRLAYSIPEFCEQIGISRAHFYNLARNDRAPRVTKIGHRSVVLVEDARMWLDALNLTEPLPVPHCTTV